MPTHNLLLIPGDGIGPEVMAEVKKLIAWMNAHGMGTFATEEGLCGGCAYDAHGVAITDAMVAKAKAADAAKRAAELSLDSERADAGLADARDTTAADALAAADARRASLPG